MMMTMRFFIIVSLLCLEMLCVSVHPVSANNSYTTAGLPRQEPKDPDWSYKNLSAWPKLCFTGKQQSPVSFAELEPHEVVHRKGVGRLDFSEDCRFAAEKTTLKIVNEVNTISVRFFSLDDPFNENPSPCTLRDPTNRRSPEYHFVSMHFHSPAEHVFPRGKPDAELHIVFAHTERLDHVQRMVVAVQLVASNKVNTTSVVALRHILAEGSLPPKHAITTCTLTEDVAIPELLPRRKSYLSYSGSLTTPPCSEGVRFVVLTSPQIISKQALEKLLDVFKKSRPGEHDGNRRPTQPLNGRVVYRFVDRSPIKTSKSKGDMEDYYKDNSSAVDVWGDDETSSGESSGALDGSDQNGSLVNKTNGSGVNSKRWPRPLRLRDSLLLLSAAIILLLVTFALYRRWNNNVVAGIGTGEMESLSRSPRGYGTNP